MRLLNFLRGAALVGVGLLLSSTPLAPLWKALIWAGLGIALSLRSTTQRNATFRANSVSTGNSLPVIIGEAIVGGHE